MGIASMASSSGEDHVPAQHYAFEHKGAMTTFDAAS